MTLDLYSPELEIPPVKKSRNMEPAPVDVAVALLGEEAVARYIHQKMGISHERQLDLKLPSMPHKNLDEKAFETRQTVFKTLVKEGALSQPQLCSVTGLTANAVRYAVNTLIAKEKLRKVGKCHRFTTYEVIDPNAPEEQEESIFERSAANRAELMKAFLAAEDGLTMPEMRRATNLTRSSVEYVLISMRSKKFVKRTKDRRDKAFVWVLTEEGQNVAGQSGK